jgi:hypothetical protein
MLNRMGLTKYFEEIHENFNPYDKERENGYFFEKGVGTKHSWHSERNEML